MCNDILCLLSNGSPGKLVSERIKGVEVNDLLVEYVLPQKIPGRE
jgi:hypothetical protein